MISQAKRLTEVTEQLMALSEAGFCLRTSKKKKNFKRQEHVQDFQLIESSGIKEKPGVSLSELQIVDFCRNFPMRARQQVSILREIRKGLCITE